MKLVAPTSADVETSRSVADYSIARSRAIPDRALIRRFPWFLPSELKHRIGKKPKNRSAGH